jgi:ribonucleoside-diphosphate reductase alpha chain
VQRARDAAYLASTELAAEKGSFPRFERNAFLAGEYSSSLPKAARDRIARHGIRNSHLLAIAPAGSISLLANNVSSGIEPVFAIDSDRQMLDEAGTATTHRVEDFAAGLWRRERKDPLPSSFITAGEIAPDEHLAMLATLQPLVDSSISKTINVPESISRSEFARIFDRAYELGTNGCTVFRPSGAASVVLTPATCCSPRRVLA